MPPRLIAPGPSWRRAAVTEARPRRLFAPELHPSRAQGARPIVASAVRSGLCGSAPVIIDRNMLCRPSIGSLGDQGIAGMRGADFDVVREREVVVVGL